MEITQAPWRAGGHPLGFHRVQMPKGVLPQAAERLDVSLPIYHNEMLIEVERLNLDSASFRQIWEEQGGVEEKVKFRILQIIRARNKMHNPVTDSGGMLLGRVSRLGKDFPGKFSEGDRIATLVSLTLTPLHLEEIFEMDASKGQVRCRGYAILFASGIATRLPDDLPVELALSVIDVCGAPAWVKRLVQPGDRVLILGMGKAGVLSALAALEVVPGSQLTVMDCREDILELASRLGGGVRSFREDVTQIEKFQDLMGQIGFFDLVIDTCNAPGTEAAAIVSTREGGKVLFFNMATQFARAVLTAEGLGKDVSLHMGNGYAKGHAGYALQLVRRNRAIFP